ncbi:MAG: hypothetical protein ABII90_00005 [Bacteroidota bacterium]
MDNMPHAIQIPQLTNMNIRYDFIVSNDSDYQKMYGEKYYILTGDSLPEIDFSSNTLFGICLQNICNNAEIKVAVETDIFAKNTIYICVEQTEECDEENCKTFWWLTPKGTLQYGYYINYIIQNSNAS